MHECPIRTPQQHKPAWLFRARSTSPTAHATSTVEPNSAAMSQAPQLPPPWQMHKSRSTNKKYYFNPKTNQSTYVFAEVLAAAGVAYTAPSLAPAAAATIQPPAPVVHLTQPLAIGAQPAQSSTSSSDLVDAAVVAQSYDKIKAQTVQERQASPIFYLRTFNNWVKAALIVMYGSHENERSVLDLACGKLGDMSKWRGQRVQRYTGVDISRNQLEEAASRFTSTTARLKQQAAEARHRHQSDKAESLMAQAFQLRLVQADLGVVDCGPAGVFSDEWSTVHASEPDKREVFGCASMQFALHYLFATEARAVQFFRTLADRVAPGGHFIGTIPDANVLIRRMRDLPPGENTFGNRLYHITVPDESLDRQYALGANPFGLRYTFFLKDQVENIDEYLVPWPLLVRLARMAGMVPVMASNFHDFFATVHGSASSSGRGAKSSLSAAHELLAPMILNKEAADRSGMSPEEWQVAGLYMVFAFKKVFPGPATDMPYAPPPAPHREVQVPAHLQEQVEAAAVGEKVNVKRIEDLPQVPVPRSGRDVYTWPQKRQRLLIPYRSAIQANQIVDAALECKLAWEAHYLEQEQHVPPSAAVSGSTTSGALEGGGLGPAATTAAAAATASAPPFTPTAPPTHHTSVAAVAPSTSGPAVATAAQALPEPSPSAGSMAATSGTVDYASAVSGTVDEFADLNAGAYADTPQAADETAQASGTATAVESVAAADDEAAYAYAAAASGGEDEDDDFEL